MVQVWKSVETTSRKLKELGIKHRIKQLNAVKQTIFEGAKHGDPVIKTAQSAKKHKERLEHLLETGFQAAKQHGTILNYTARVKGNRVVAFLHFTRKKE